MLMVDDQDQLVNDEKVNPYYHLKTNFIFEFNSPRSGAAFCPKMTNFPEIRPNKLVLTLWFFSQAWFFI